MTVVIPDSHLGLLTGRAWGVATTLASDGAPRSSMVWVDHDGTHACFNTTLDRHKGRDILRDPRMSLLVVDPGDTGRFIQIRGRVELVTDGAVDHLDALTRRYTGHPRYYGFVYPTEQATRETRVIARIDATKITLDAIH